jgi:hypothetical protein
MVDRPQALEPETLENLRDSYETWKSRPFSSELLEALAGRLRDPKRRAAILGMLRSDSADLTLDFVRARRDTPRQVKRIFTYFWRSGLFEEGRKLLAVSPELRRSVGLERPSRPGDKLGPPVYADDPISLFEASERGVRLGLWGWSEAARGLRNSVLRTAREAQPLGMLDAPLGILNVGVGGPMGIEKARMAELIHALAKRGSFRALGPEDEGADEALSAAMSGGTLDLRGCDHLRESVRSSVYAAMTTRVHRGTPMDTLLIVDSPAIRIHGYASGTQLGSGAKLIGTLGRMVPGQWSFFPIPHLRQRAKDVPLLVNKTLKFVHADDLADVRHHLACWLMEEIERSPAKLDVGWLENAIVDVCRTLCPDWTPSADTPQSSVEGTDTEKSGSSEDNCFWRCNLGWEVTFDGTSRHISTESKGMWGIRYLLSVRRPSRGAIDVWDAMPDPGGVGSSAVDPTTAREYQEAGHSIGPEEHLKHSDDDTKVACKRRLAEIAEKLQQGPSGNERDTLEDEQEEIHEYLRQDLSLRGKSRTEHRRGHGQRVGSAISRSLKQIKKQFPEFHEHLVESLKGPHGEDIRYEPPEGTRNWQVDT